MKLIEAIEQVKRQKPNSYSDEALVDWLNELEAQMQSEVLHTDPAEIIHYTWLDDNEVELLIPSPYDRAYISYISAKIDFNNQEWASYNNTMMQHTSDYDEFKRWWMREHNPVADVKIKNYW